MLQLYPSTQVDFTNNGEPIRHSFDERVIREDGFYLTFKLLLDENKEYKKVQLENIIGAMTPDGMNYFKVYDVIPKTDHVEIIALQLFYYLDYRRIKPFTLRNATGLAAIKALEHNFVSSIDPYTFDSSVNETHDFSVDTTGSDEAKYYNALEIANRIANRWDSEFMLNGYDVRMVKRLGKKTDALLYEKKNISEFEFENSARSLVTRIYAVSRWTLDRDDPEFVEDADNEREIRVTVDSPLINEYSQIYEEEYTNNDLRTEQELINWASLKYSTDNVDKPSRSIELKANIVDGTEINYGDGLVLKYLTHDIDETIRCVGYDFNPVTEDYYSVTLGDWRDSFGRSFNRQVADVSDRQQSQLDRLEREVQIAQMSANGKNRVTYGENPVPNPIDGDIWLYHPIDRPDEVELRIYNAESGQWERKDVSSEIIKQQFEEVDRIQQELIADVEASENKAQQAIEDAGLAQVTADTAKGLAEQAQLSADNAQGRANDALDYAQNIVDNKGSLLGLDSIQQSINDIENPSSETWADIISSEAGHLYTYNQQRDATLLSSASTQTASQITNALSSYTTTDNLDGVVTNLLSSESTQTAGYISNILTNYAKQTDLTGMVTESILQSKNYITASEASQTFVNQTNLDGSVASLLSSETSQTAGSLTTILTDYVAGNIDLSGYVTETILESRNYLTASAAEQIFVKTELLDGEIVGVLSSGNSQTAQYIQDYVIGEDYISEVIQTSDLIQSEIKRIVPVPTEAEIIALAEATQLDRADIEAMFEDGFLTQEDLDMIAELTGMTPEQVQLMVNNILNSELVQQYETVTKTIDIFRQTGFMSGVSDGTHIRFYVVIEHDLVVGKPYEIKFDYPTGPSDRGFILYHDGRFIDGNTPVNYIKANLNKAEFTLVPTQAVPAGQTIQIRIDDSRPGSYALGNLLIRGEGEVRVPIVSQNNGVIANRITQTQNAIDMGLFGEEGALTRIYAGEEGLYLKGENIVLDGKVSMEQAFIKNLVASEITANTIASVSGTFSNLISTNIDAQSITTETLNSLRNRIMGVYTYVDIKGDGIGIYRYDGTRSMELYTGGMRIYRGGNNIAGHIGGANDAANVYSGVIHIGAERGNIVSLSSKQLGSNEEWIRSLWVDGTTGQIKINNPIMLAESGLGIRLQQLTLTGYGTGIAIRTASGTQAGIAFVGGRVLWQDFGGSWKILSEWAVGRSAE